MSHANGLRRLVRRAVEAGRRSATGRWRCNEAAALALAEAFGLLPRQVRLVGRATSRTKRFEIEGLTADELSRRLVLPNPPRA